MVLSKTHISKRKTHIWHKPAQKTTMPDYSAPLL